MLCFIPQDSLPFYKHPARSTRVEWHSRKQLPLGPSGSCILLRASLFSLTKITVFRWLHFYKKFKQQKIKKYFPKSCFPSKQTHPKSVPSDSFCFLWKGATIVDATAFRTGGMDAVDEPWDETHAEARKCPRSPPLMAHLVITWELSLHS